jgi:hypothetical protein
MAMKIKLAPIGAGLLLLLISCNKFGEGGNSPAKSEEVSDVQFQYLAADSTAGGNEYKQQAPPPPGTGQAAANPDWDRKIIKVGTLNMEVADYSKFYALLRESVRNAGGYISSEDQNKTPYKIENVVTIKVPVAQFEQAMVLLTNGTGKDKVLERKITSDDVTGEVVDTKSRMEAKRQVRQRYLELLNQAKNMEDILKVQDEINSIQEEIEMGAGRVNYLNHASALSTIQLTFFQVLNATAPQDPTEPSFFTKLWHSFEQGWSFIKSLVLGLVTLWPLWLMVLTVWLVLKRYKISLLPGKVEKPTKLNG